MTDPGLPPKPRTLNLLDTLVKEEEARDKERLSPKVVIPTQGTGFSSPEFFDPDKQQILTREASASSYTEFKMKDTDGLNRSDPKSGFKGKKMAKRSGPPVNTKQKKRPFSADYNQSQRNKINSNNLRNGRPMTSKGPRGRKRSTSPKGGRSRSLRSYSSDSYSSDDAYGIRRDGQPRYVEDSKKDKNIPEGDSFFDSNSDNDRPGQRESKKSESTIYSDNDRPGQRESKKESTRYSRSSSSSSTDSYSSSEEDYKTSKNKPMNGHASIDRKTQSSKVVYVGKDGQQKTHTESESSDYQRMVVVDDYSSSSSSSDEEVVETKPEPKKKVTTLKPKTLLARKKRPSYKISEITPDQYIEGKLQQKYVELEELMACNFVDQRSQVTRHHLYQMELLRDQYRDASHGLPASTLIIPRSLPEEVRNRKLAGQQQQRPASGKKGRHDRRGSEGDQPTYDNAYGTIRSVMAAEHARKTNKIRTDIHADRPSSGKQSVKKKKKIEAKLKAKHSESEEDISERPSVSSKGSQRSTNPESQYSTPRSGPAIDHHIKYTDNKKLKRWLKEKDKIYRQNLREDKKKKREEREKVITEANEKIEKRIKSQKAMKAWMKEKNKELLQKQREDSKMRAEEEKHAQKRMEMNLPGDTMKIRPQSAPVARSTDGGQTDSKYVKKEDNKQTKLTHNGTPHPPQTKFIYKRPVAGKIKLKMEVRGKSPVAGKSESEKQDDEKDSEKENSKQMRMSYDEWVKKKHTDNAQKKKEADLEKKKALAKSDPELDRIIPDIAKKRIEDKLNMRKKVNTGIKKFDDKANKSFGGADFDGESSETDRPKNPYKLEGDKQLQRPSTAPAGRAKVPHPKKSATSPRKAIIPKRADKVMSNEDQSNPFNLPFPPEKGVPEYVASRQRKLFADKITERLDEIEQRALLNAELISAGVADEAGVENAEMENLNLVQTKMEEDAEQESASENKHLNINELMYSPKKKDESSESSEEENKPDIQVTIEPKATDKPVVSNEETVTANNEESASSKTETVSEAKTDLGAGDNDTDIGPPVITKNLYKSFDNLNELHGDNSESQENKNTTDDLNIDIEHLKERVAALHTETVLEPQISTAELEERNKKTMDEDIDDHKAESEQPKVELNVEQNDPNLVGILKESKKGDTIPIPEKSDEPQTFHFENEDETLDIPSPQDDNLNQSRKRVSFNEQTEVFQSFDSSSTETITPEQEEFDAEAESLETQPYYVDDPDWDDTEDKPDVQMATEKMSINIGGFELNPTVISTEYVEGDDADNDKKEDVESKPDNSDNQATFLTEPSGSDKD